MYIKLSRLLDFKSIAYIFLPLLIVSCSDNRKQNVYVCNYLDAAYSCDKECVVEKDWKYSFLVNKSQKSVLHVSYIDGEQTMSVIHKECTIFDEKNWDCSDYSTHDYVTIDKVAKMINGTFVMKFEFRDRVSRELRNTNDKPICSK